MTRDFRVVLGLLGVIATLGWCLAPPPRVRPPASTFPYRQNPSAYLEYRGRLRGEFALEIRATVTRNAELIEKFRRGDYGGRPQRFEADNSEFCNSLLEHIRQFDEQAVPDVLARAHRKISNSHWLCYESMLVLREAYRSQGEEQKRLLGEAEGKMGNARRVMNEGLKEVPGTNPHRE